MEQASEALNTGQYLDSALLCRHALTLARAENDFERMHRICMPMLEAQRYLRQDALDTGVIHQIAHSSDIPESPGSACYLFAPNFVGADALRFRNAAYDAGIAPFVLTREPTTSKNQWPIVGVAERVVRVRIDPPKDDTPNPKWFSHAAEQLGDQGIRDALDAGKPDDPPAWIVDDFLDRLDACPEHEKFIMALAKACANAIGQPKPTGKRRRGIIDDPYSF
ncbi:MAG: hypothetical protein ACF8K1_04745 [Phycisphaerales bacterium JB047]